MYPVSSDVLFFNYPLGWLNSTDGGRLFYNCLTYNVSLVHPTLRPPTATLSANATVIVAASLATNGGADIIRSSINCSIATSSNGTLMNMNSNLTDQFIGTVKGFF